MVTTTRVMMVGWPKRGAALLEAGLRFQEQLLAAAAEAGQQMMALAIKESPVGTNDAPHLRFKDSWNFETMPVYGGARTVLGNYAPHVNYVIDPTRPHDIWANHMLGQTRYSSSPRPLAGVGGGLGFLRFMGRGGVTFAHMVHHPGTPGNDVPGRVNALMQPRYQEILQKHAGDLAGQIKTVISD